MRRPVSLFAVALLAVSCGSAASAPPSPSPVTSTTPMASVAVAARPSATYAPTSEGFESKQLVQIKRNLGVSAPGTIWIVAGASPDGIGVTATVSDKESFTASYQVPVDRQAADVAQALYVTPDLPPLPAGLYGESLTLVTVQPGGRSAAHMHSGIEGVLVLDGNVLVRTAGHDPVSLVKGQGFYILPKTPIQLINVGGSVARTLVYSISPDGAAFSTPVDTAP